MSSKPFQIILGPATLIAALSLAMPATAAESTEEMRQMARIFAALDARDQKSYCEAMHGAAYTGYVDKACRLAVQNRLKQPEECAAERIAEEVRNDKQNCLAMPAAEFEKARARVEEGKKTYLQKLAAQGIDGEKLIQEEQSKMR